MILIAFGANLNSHVGSPIATIKCAVKDLKSKGIYFIKSSRFYETEPVPSSNYPNYINSVSIIETKSNPYELLDILHDIEAMYGRERSFKNSPRTLDIDLLSFNNSIIKNEKIEIPHPRLHKRGFIMIPIQEVAKDWKHPLLNVSIRDLINNLEMDNKVLPLHRFF